MRVMQLLAVSATLVAIATTTALPAEATPAAPVTQSAPIAAGQMVSPAVTSQAQALAAANKTLPGFKLKLHKNYLHLSWKKVPGSGKYSVTMVRKNFIGPPQPHRTSKTSMDFRYKNFPDLLRQLPKNPVIFQVWKGRYSATKVGISKKQLALHAKTVKVTKNNAWKSKTAKLVGKCVAIGGATAVGMGVAGAGYMAAAAWIPGLGEITAAAVISDAIIAGVGSTITCLVLERD